MIDGCYTHEHLDLFKATPGWKILTESDRSLFEAYLRRSESWDLSEFLKVLDTNIDITSLDPQHLVSNVTTATPPIIPPLNIKNHVPVRTPPNAAELRELHRKWERDWKRKQRALAKGKGDATDSAHASVTLTKAEIAAVSEQAKQRSREVAGHGRPAHGSYASSSSPATAERDRQRSEARAVEVALNAALERKRKAAGRK